MKKNKIILNEIQEKQLKFIAEAIGMSIEELKNRNYVIEKEDVILVHDVILWLLEETGINRAYTKENTNLLFEKIEFEEE